MGVKGMEKIVGDNFLHPAPPLYMYIYDLLYLLWLVLKLYIQSSVKISIQSWSTSACTA